MTEDNSKLEQRILTEIQHLQKQASTPREPDRTQILGAFLEATLSNKHISKDRFAAQIDAEEELVQGLLEGLIPEAEMDDDWIVMIAKVIDTPPNTLRIILGRTITPAADDTDEPKPAISR